MDVAFSFIVFIVNTSTLLYSSDVVNEKVEIRSDWLYVYLLFFIPPKEENRIALLYYLVVDCNALEFWQY